MLQFLELIPNLLLRILVERPIETVLTLLISARKITVRWVSLVHGLLSLIPGRWQCHRPTGFELFAQIGYRCLTAYIQRNIVELERVKIEIV